MKHVVGVALFFLVVANYISAQGVIFTTQGDTIAYTKLDFKGLSYKVWTNKSSPVTYKMEGMTSKMDSPVYRLLVNEIDEISGDINKFSKFYVIGRTIKSDFRGFHDVIGVELNQINNTFFLSLRSAINLGCAGALDNYVIIKFEDGTKLELTKDVAKVDCDRSATSSFILEPEHLLELSKKSIKYIRFQKSESFEDFSIVYKDIFIKLIPLYTK